MKKKYNDKIFIHTQFRAHQVPGVVKTMNIISQLPELPALLEIRISLPDKMSAEQRECFENDGVRALKQGIEKSAEKLDWLYEKKA